MDELLDMEHAGWASLCNGTASDFYGDLMADDGVMVLANGTVMNRDEVVHALRNAPPWAAYDIDDVRLVPLGANSTAIVYLGTGHRGGEEPPFVGVMTSVYVERDGNWKLALYQQTPKP
jgi:hypothetical protein